MADFIDSVISNTPPGGRQDAAQKIRTADDSRVSHARMAYRGRHRGDPTYIQHFSQGQGSTAEDVSLETQLYLNDPDYYFELQPLELDETRGGDRFVPLPPGAPLRAGRRYRIRVSLSQNEYRGSFQAAGQAYQLTQRPFKFPDEVFVQLGVVGQDPNLFSAVGLVAPTQGRLSFKDQEAQFQDFEFTIQKDYRLEITFQLLCWRVDDTRLQYPAAQLVLILEGSQSPPPPEFSKVFELPAKVSPPPDAVILHVSPSDAGGLRLLGWAGTHVDSSLTIDVGAFKWVDPENCPDEQSYLQRLSDSFHDYSIEQGSNVTGWLEKALSRYGERCSVIIVDEAGMPIPWEMLKLTDGRYLGAHALVVRWAEAQYGGLEAAAEGPRYEGRVCAYVHPLDAPNVAGLLDMNRLLPEYQVTPEEFEIDLLCGSQPGLVYLCYGGLLYYGDETDVIAHLSRFAPYNEDVRIRFNTVSNHLKPRPLFFANAPYSGRLLKTGQQNCGLARAILKQVAASYIGTLGPVERSYAIRFARTLLEAACSEEGVRPAELLRQLRAQAIERLRDKRLPQAERVRAYKELAYPFMYVHYGHPLDSIKISHAPQGADVEGGGADG